MRHYDGSQRWEAIERALRRDGYAMRFACATFDRQPADLGYTGLENGWELRRKLKAWCAAHGVADPVIVRNTSYHRDLHGPVYELWTRETEPTCSQPSRSSDSRPSETSPDQPAR